MKCISVDVNERRRIRNHHQMVFSFVYIEVLDKMLDNDIRAVFMFYFTKD